MGLGIMIGARLTGHGVLVYAGLDIGVGVGFCAGISEGSDGVGCRGYSGDCELGEGRYTVPPVGSEY